MSSTPKESKLSGYWRIIRPLDDFVLGLGVIVAMALAGSFQLGLPLLGYLLAFTGTFFVSGHAMVVNDIIDVNIDIINEPDRVLPSGIISTKNALVYSIFLAIVGLLCFVLIDILGFVKYPYMWLFVLGNVLLADAYNLKLKKIGFIGNIVVAWASYAIFFLADLFLNGKLTMIPQTVGLMAFFASLSREIFKGIIDQEGDKKHGVNTVALAQGATFAKAVAMVILSLCLVLAVYAFINLFLIAKIGLILFSIMFVYALVLARNAEKPQVSRTIKHIILAGPLLVSPFLIIDQLVLITF